MPRSSAQSDFVVTPRRQELPSVELPNEARPIQLPLPRALLRSDEASAAATRWVMWFVWIVLGLLLVLTLVGPHIPGGE